MAATMPTEPAVDSMALACGGQAAAPFGADIDPLTCVASLVLLSGSAFRLCVSALRFRLWSGRYRNRRVRTVRNDRLAWPGQVEEKSTAIEPQLERATPDPRSPLLRARAAEMRGHLLVLGDQVDDLHPEVGERDAERPDPLPCRLGELAVGYFGQ